MSKNDFLKEYKEFVFSKLEMNKSYPNGESPKDFYNRIKKGFIKLNNKFAKQNIVLISHGGVYGVIKSLIKGVRWSNKQKYKISHAEFKVFSKDI